MAAAGRPQLPSRRDGRTLGTRPRCGACRPATPSLSTHLSACRPVAPLQNDDSAARSAGRLSGSCCWILISPGRSPGSCLRWRTRAVRRWSCIVPKAYAHLAVAPRGAGPVRPPPAFGAWRSTDSSSHARASGSSRATSPSRRPDRSTRWPHPVAGIDPAAKRSCRSACDAPCLRPMRPCRRGLGPGRRAVLARREPSDESPTKQPIRPPRDRGIRRSALSRRPAPADPVAPALGAVGRTSRARDRAGWND